MLAQPAMRNFMGFAPYQNQPSDAHPSNDYDQYVPQSRPYARSVGTYNAGLTYAQHELLRSRKTPAGLQVETLDIANIDSQLDIPAPKHILLSLSPESASRGFTHANQSSSLAQPETSGRQQYRTVIQRDQNRGVVDSSWSLTGGYDSALTQDPQLVAHHRHVNHGYSQVPIVLPANLQTSYGPTASAGQQYYGPYWPDGTFSPYRPDPIRDDRYFHWRHSRDLSRGSFSPPENYDGLQQNRLYPPQPLARPTNMIQGVRSMQALPPRDVGMPYASFQDRISSALDSTAFSSTVSNLNQQNIGHRSDRTFLDTEFRPTPASGRIMHREKTFAWAYRVYVELLAQVQRESKAIKQQNASTGTTKLSAKPAIFPRPPQRTQSHFGGSVPKETDNTSILTIKPQPSVSNEMYERPLTAINTSRHDQDLKMLSIIPTQPYSVPQDQPSSSMYGSYYNKPFDFSASARVEIPNPVERYTAARRALSEVESLSSINTRR